MCLVTKDVHVRTLAHLHARWYHAPGVSGWIPERLDVKDCTDAEWTRIGRGLATGDVLLTISTADMTEAEEDRTGLVPGKCTCAPVQLSECSRGWKTDTNRPCANGTKLMRAQ